MPVTGMPSPHICLACRRRLSQIRPARVLPWQPRATFISLTNNLPRTTTGEKFNDDPSKVRNGSRSHRGKYAAAVPTTPKRTPQPESDSPADVLESLFEQSLHPPTPTGNVAQHPSSSLEPYKNAEAFREILSSSAPVSDSWHFFVAHFGPDTMKSGMIDQKSLPHYVRPAAKDLLRRIVHAKKETPFSRTLPSVTELSKVYLQLGMLHGTEWTEMVLILLESLLKNEGELSSDVGTEERLISDLLGAWNVACRDIRRLQRFPPAASISLDWSNLPLISSRDAVQVHRKRGTKQAFALLVPTFAIRETMAVPLVALATFGFLTNDSLQHRALLDDASPLVSLLSRIINVPGLDINQFYDTSQETEVSCIPGFVKKDWIRIKEQAVQMSQNSSTESVIKERSSHDGIQANMSFINKRLHDALIRRNPRQVDELWADVVQWPVGNTETGGRASQQRGNLSKELCNYFILVYMGLRQPNRAIDVWNHMVHSGLSPTLATWDSMLSGCKAARDVKALEGVWAKMQMARVQPDVFCWATRISGLIECRREDAGIQALDEMGRVWLDAAKQKHPKMSLEQVQMVDDVETAVKPTIAVINAAIGALLRKQMTEAAYRILAWAGKFGLSPDVITYNTLLRPLIRDGRSKEAMALVQQMQRTGVEADVATFTTILDETFRYSDQHTPEEQKTIVDSIFSEMEAAGVTANLHTYGKIIYQILQSTNGDMMTVNAIMERMAKQGLQPSSYIYTILIEYYFTRNPPDLDAVRNTIERATMAVGSTDHVFWDRVVEGYAQAGETGPAMRILGKVNSTNGTVGWLALRTLLLALAESQEWDLARTLVGNAIIDSGGPLAKSEHGKEGQHKFWRLASELDLLGEK